MLFPSHDPLGDKGVHTSRLRNIHNALLKNIDKYNDEQIKKHKAFLDLQISLTEKQQRLGHQRQLEKEKRFRDQKRKYNATENEKVRRESINAEIEGTKREMSRVQKEAVNPYDKAIQSKNKEALREITRFQSFEKTSKSIDEVNRAYKRLG